MAKVNSIDTSDFVIKAKYQTDKTELEKKIPDASNLVKKQNSLNQKTNSRCKQFRNKNCIKFCRK